ncbi:hypothetical protein [Streptomyces alanosinicus]|uniref:hypothetical protein n=1 Tax=Streptomyces alanosinicus TaxID=68171 RepID=UPI001677C043|nr:hypothetical protein [Streptomyces alanosinicus]
MRALDRRTRRTPPPSVVIFGRLNRTMAALGRAAGRRSMVQVMGRATSAGQSVM